MSLELNESDIEKYAKLVHKCIEEDSPNKIIATLCMLTKQQRKAVVTLKVDGNPALCFACLENKADFVRYLLKECDADIEQRGLYIDPKYKTKLEVPPLWCATVPEKGIEIVQILLEHGADPNGHSNTQSTPVRSACYSLNIPAVKLLVEHGADVNKTNLYGSTCLMVSTPSAELCAYLISKGVNVNSVDTYKYTAVHYASQDNQLETVQLLFQNGAVLNIRTQNGDTPLRTAAYKGHVSVVQYLLNTKVFSTEDEIESYELLGCFLVDDDVTRCVKMWESAIHLRSQLNGNVYIYTKNTKPRPEFMNTVDISTVDGLYNLIDPNDFYMQALHKYSLIYGETDSTTISEIINRGAFYADNGCYHRCLDLWKYCYKLRFNQNDPLNRDTVNSVIDLVYLMCEMQKDLEAGKTKEIIQTADLLEIFQMIVDQIEFGQNVFKVRPININDAEQYQDLMELTLHIVQIFRCLVVTETGKDTFSHLFLHVLEIDPRGTANQTLLHLAVNPQTSYMRNNFLTKFPSLHVVKLLLLCGVRIDVRDDAGHTALDRSIKYSNDREK